MRTLVCIITIAATAFPLAADWTLAEHAGSVLMHHTLGLPVEYNEVDGILKGARRGHFLPSATMGEDGKLEPYKGGMEVNGELREGQFLLTPDNSMAPAWAEFVLDGCTQVTLQYGHCDGSKADGTQLTFFFHPVDDPDGEPVAQKQIRLTEREWKTETIDLPGGDLLARVKVEFVGHKGWNWTALVCSGDGEIGTREEVRALSPLVREAQEMRKELEPADVHVRAPDGYDSLFLGDTPYINYAAKGHRAGTQSIQENVGINLFYEEWPEWVSQSRFQMYWPKGRDHFEVPAESGTYMNMYVCKQEDMPYKTGVGMAHNVFFLPEWLVEQEELFVEPRPDYGEEGPKAGGRSVPPHTSFIKPKTVQWCKRLLDGWAGFFAPQAAIFVLGQEDHIETWDCQSDEAKAAFRAWLSERFGGDFTAFAEYVGGVEDCDDFENAPYLKHLSSHEAYGYPRRAAYLKYMWQVEAYADFLTTLKDHCRSVAPNVPVTQRYVGSPTSVPVSEMVDFDYNYMYGHMSEEGVEGRYGSGKKIWTGIYGYCGLLPTPRGGSIGKTIDLDVRRGPMTEGEWETNAWTLLANGCTGYEMQPLFAIWGDRWSPGALVDEEGTINEQGRLSAKVMGEVTSVAPYCEHYDRYEDVAVFHDSAWQCGRGIGLGLSQSKIGLHTMIREMGYHQDPVTIWEMTPENLADREVLVLAGTVPIAPEIQDVIREYVRNGGTLLTFYSAAGQGFPGSNGWEFAGGASQAAAQMSFDDPPARAHLGDVLGITSGGGNARRASVVDLIEFAEYNAMVDEGRWADTEACAATLVPAETAEVMWRFDDGTPAVVGNQFGEGLAVTVGFDPGLLASNLWPEDLYRMVDDFLADQGCRKPYDTGDYHVEAGVWHNDEGERLLILVNHDMQNARTAPLPDGTEVTIEPWRAHVWTSDRGSL